MKKRTSLWATAGVFCLGVLTTVGFSVQANAAAKCITGDRKPPYTLGWANIYSVPTWMKQTEGTITSMVEELKKEGLVDELVITDAQGDANTQIQQIQSMIDADVDAILLIAGSSTAPARVIEAACAKGIAVINFDSLVDTDQVTAKINTDSNKWGDTAAKWLIDKLGGKGKILVLNGPAGISVSDTGLSPAPASRSRTMSASANCFAARNSVRNSTSRSMNGAASAEPGVGAASVKPSTPASSRNNPCASDTDFPSAAPRLIARARSNSAAIARGVFRSSSIAVMKRAFVSPGSTSPFELPASRNAAPRRRSAPAFEPSIASSV